MFVSRYYSVVRDDVVLYVPYLVLHIFVNPITEIHNRGVELNAGCDFRQLQFLAHRHLHNDFFSSVGLAICCWLFADCRKTAKSLIFVVKVIILARL